MTSKAKEMHLKFLIGTYPRSDFFEQTETSAHLFFKCMYVEPIRYMTGFSY